jgi:acetyl esterase/lipase
MKKKIFLYISLLFLLLLSVGGIMIYNSIIRIQLPHGAILHVLPASKDSQAHGAVIMCPGGGYRYLENWKEGFWWFPFFYRQGYTIALLEYRMPNHDYRIPLTDGAEAVKTMRKYAKEWHFDKDKVGIMGFSAGGHLASMMLVSDNDDVRPDFGMLFYPVVSMRKGITHQDSHDCLLGKNSSEALDSLLSNELHISEKRPPVYIAFSKDDTGVITRNAMLFHDKMREKHRPVSLHIYPSGGHGWGYRLTFKYHNQMLDDLTDWMKKDN